MSDQSHFTQLIGDLVITLKSNKNNNSIDIDASQGRGSILNLQSMWKE
jgi:hypothetical protein